MNDRRVLRHEVSVDDQPHEIADGPVVMVAPWRQAPTRPAGRVEVWVEACTPDEFPHGPPPRTRHVQVVGTGHLVPPGATWLGSCLDESLVWHLYEIEEDRE